MYTMKLQKSHPLHGEWSFPAQQLPACKSFPNNSMLVLDVDYADKDIAKQLTGAQFDPHFSVWFHNPDAPWNRSFAADKIREEVNNRKWFVGYAYINALPNPNVRYPTSICSFTWLDTLFTADYYNSLPTKTMFTTHSWYDSKVVGPLLSIIIFKPNNSKTAAYLVEYGVRPDVVSGVSLSKVSSMRQISLDDARAFWDIASKNKHLKLMTGENGETGVRPDVIGFMEDVEARAGTGAIALQSAIAAYSNKNTFDPITKQYFTNLPKVAGVQYKTAPNGGSIPVNISDSHPTDTNYAINA